MKNVYREKTVKRISAKMAMLGRKNKKDTMLFLHIRLVFALLLFLVILLTNKFGYFLAPILTILFYVTFEKIILDTKIKSRAKILENEAIPFFEVLVLTMDTGRSLSASLRATVKNIDSEISEEFKHTLSEVRLGKSLKESLENMRARIPSDTINTIIINLTRESANGEKTKELLAHQLDILREKRDLDIKLRIHKIPIKIIAVTILLYVPLVLSIVFFQTILDFFVK